MFDLGCISSAAANAQGSEARLRTLPKSRKGFFCRGKAPAEIAKVELASPSGYRTVSLTVKLCNPVFPLLLPAVPVALIGIV